MTIYVSDKLQATAAPVSGEPTPSTSWQWLRNNSAIAGATSSEYILTAADAGANISVMQSAINMLGTAVANSASQGPVSAFTPDLLFRNNVVGTWYDPSDTSTLFQNANGSTPVTAVEQPVGLMLDKSGRGNHAFNSSGNSANFPVLSARYNLLTKSEDFSDAVWVKAGGTSYANSTTAPDGTQTGTLFIENTSNSTHGYWQVTSSIPAAVNAKYTINLKYHSRRYVRVAWVTGGGIESVYADVDLIAGTIVNQGPYAGATQSSATITSAGSGWYTVEVKGTLPSATTYATVYARNSSSNSNPESAFTYTGDGTSGFYVWHPDLRVANDGVNLPAYQRVNTSTDYDSSAVWPRYLRFNGTNQWLQTSSIDFTGTDKMFVSAGVRKLSDAAVGIIAETSVASFSNNGAFVLAGPGSTAAAYSVLTRGTSAASLAFSAAAPTTNVVSAALNIAGATVSDEIILRNNGAPASTSVENVGPAGTGNYGNYPLYIGARAGSTLWFNGRLYSLITAGKLANAVEITETENYINTKTKAYA